MATDIAQQLDSSPEESDEDEVFLGLERFRDWAHSDLYPEHGKFSYVQGVLEAEMSPESLHEHNFVKTRITISLGSLIDQLQLGQLFSDRSLFVNEAAALATEPDVMFCKWTSLQSGRARLLSYKNSPNGLVELQGVPDLVVEIVSPSSVKKDKVRLKKAYFECGIPEYWLIDARSAKLNFTLFVRGEREFRPVQPEADEYLFSPVFDRAFRLERTPHPLVGFHYQLLFRKRGDA